MTNSKYVPKRRFKEFELDGEWEQDLLGNIADFSIKTNSFSREKLTHESYEVQNIHYGDILIKFQSVLDLKRDNLPSIIDSSVLDFRQSLLQDGDVIFADAAEDSTVGKAIEIRNIMGKNVVSGLHTIAARPIQLFAPYYLGYYLNSDFYHKQILPLMQGTKVSSISKSNLQVTEISFPIIDEQKKIGKFFQKIASLIALHQHKLDKLKNLKKAYLSEMFPAEGELVPKRRFPGFEGEWEYNKLMELAEFSKGKGYSKSDLQVEGQPIILYGRLYTKYETVISQVDTFTDIKENSVLSKGGEVLVPSSGESADDIARASVVDKAGIIIGGDLNIIKLYEKVEPVFLALAISNGKQKEEISKRAQGKSVVHVNNDDLKQVSILSPSLSEQKQIGNFFKKLDQSISLQQQKLDKLNDLKKAYLNELFV